MRKSLQPFRLFLSCFLVLLVAGQGLASDFVLCIGEGDHYALEQTLTGKCLPTEAPCQGEPELACEHDHCGPCRDIEASLQSLQPRFRDQVDSPQAVSQAPAPLFCKLDDLIGSLTGNPFAQPPPRYPDSLAVLRTIVLLI